MTTQTKGAKPKLAIISTYDELCGIAGYTRALVEYISEDFEIEVFDLDQYLLRGRGGRRAKLGDAQIAEICERLADFDAVNLQLEYGTLGPDYPDILRRFRMILRAAPRLSVTFHTILPSRPFPTDDLRRRLFRFELWNSFVVVRDWRAAKRFRAEIYHSLRETQKTKPLSIIVHTKRDARDMQVAERFEHVFGHPLAFLSKTRTEALAPRAVRSAFDGLEDLQPQTKLIGVFGFVNTYKGIHTAIRALSLLPEDHHLAIFGGLHPGEIRPETGGDTHPYIERLLGEAHVGETLLDAMGGNGSAQVDVSAVQGASDPAAFIRSPRDLRDRIHFMGV